MSARGVLRKILHRARPVFSPVAVVAALLAAGPAMADGPGGTAATASSPALPGRAGVSIVRGAPADIGDWPWQVAVAFRRSAAAGKTRPVARVYCGGSLLAPRLVITAGHCVSFLSGPKAKQLEVISGRTWLNRESTGRVTPVAGVVMPKDPKTGRPRFRETDGGAFWDVALLRLKWPLSSPALRLPGADEAAAWKPGHLARATGWGTVNGHSRKASPRLRTARQVILPDRVCRNANGTLYRPRLMSCSGGPAGGASTCAGDSGGPLAARVVDGYRLVGLTSWGDGTCRGSMPSVTTRLTDGPIRRWVVATALRLTGTDVTGGGSAVPAAPEWCRVPRLTGLTLAVARSRLKANRCGLGKVSRDPYTTGSRRKISGVSRFPGWLAPPGFRLQVWLPR